MIDDDAVSSWSATTSVPDAHSPQPVRTGPGRHGAKITLYAAQSTGHDVVRAIEQTGPRNEWPRCLATE